MVTFNHDVKTFHESLGIHPDRATVLSGTILFEMINQSYLVSKLFDNPDQAPRNMVTKTGVLEKVLTYAKDENEIMFCVYECSKINTLNDVSKKGEQAMVGVHLLFMMCDMDYDKFIKKFVQKKKEHDEEED